MARAQFVSPWAELEAPSLSDFELLAGTAFDELPEHFRALAGTIRFAVADFPDSSVLQEMGLESPYDLLGLFQGLGMTETGGTEDTGQLPNMIWLYRRPILDYWADSDHTLAALITHVLVHEIGHHFGLSDEDMAAIEAQADIG